MTQPTMSLRLSHQSFPIGVLSMALLGLFSLPSCDAIVDGLDFTAHGIDVEVMLDGPEHSDLCALYDVGTFDVRLSGPGTHEPSHLDCSSQDKVHAIKLGLEEGDYTVLVKAYDPHGKMLASQTRRAVVDGTSLGPVLVEVHFGSVDFGR